MDRKGRGPTCLSYRAVAPCDAFRLPPLQCEFSVFGFWNLNALCVFGRVRFRDAFWPLNVFARHASAFCLPLSVCLLVFHLSQHQLIGTCGACGGLFAAVACARTTSDWEAFHLNLNLLSVD